MACGDGVQDPATREVYIDRLTGAMTTAAEALRAFCGDVVAA
jgi:hypothetical protein